MYAEKINIIKEGLKKDILKMKDDTNVKQKILDEDNFIKIMQN